MTVIDLSNLDVIHDSGLRTDPPGQTYDHMRIVHVPSVDRKVRTRIHHDSSYPRQCWYVVEVWNFSLGWQEVARLNHGDVPQTALPSGYLPKASWKHQAHQAVEALVRHLQEIAVRVVS